MDALLSAHGARGHEIGVESAGALLEGVERTVEAEVAVPATACTGVMGVPGLLQVGVIRRPELPQPAFDVNRVDASAQAYQALGLPDAAVGALSCSVTPVLAGAGGARPTRWRAALLAAKASIDAAYAANLTSDQATKHRAACSWCLGTTAMTMATLVDSVRALREAGR